MAALTKGVRHGTRRHPRGRDLRPHRRPAPAPQAGQGARGGGRGPQREVELDPVEHLGRRRPDDRRAGHVPAGADLPAQGHRVPSGPGHGHPPRGRRRARHAVRRHHLHRSLPGGADGDAGVRLPDQRHRSEAQLRGHRGPRSRREQPLGVHRGPRHRGSRSPGPGDREDAGWTAPDHRRRNRARHLHLRGRGLRVRVQRRARAAPGRRPRHGRPRVPDQRVRARRLRRRRDGLHPEGLPDHQQDLDRVAVPRARDARDPRRPRREGRARASSTTSSSTAPATPWTSTSRCCSPRSAART